jgi:uncharacterized membrane protein
VFLGSHNELIVLLRALIGLLIVGLAVGITYLKDRAAEQIRADVASLTPNEAQEQRAERRRLIEARRRARRVTRRLE